MSSPKKSPSSSEVYESVLAISQLTKGSDEGFFIHGCMKDPKAVTHIVEAYKATRREKKLPSKVSDKALDGYDEIYSEHCAVLYEAAKTPSGRERIMEILKNTSEHKIKGNQRGLVRLNRQ